MAMKCFGLSFLAGIVALAVLLVGEVRDRCYGKVSVDSWLPANYWIKDGIAAKSEGRKILILGGSGSAFSVHSEVVEQVTGIHTVNLATHAGVPLRFYQIPVARHVREGDIVVLPLETHNHYCVSSSWLFYDFPLGLMLGVDRDFQRTLSASELFALYLRYAPAWYLRSFNGKAAENFDSDSLLKAWTAAKAEPEDCQKGYDLKYLNERGDRLVPFGRIKDFDDLVSTTEVTDEFIESFNKLRALVNGRGAHLILTFPNQKSYADNVQLEVLLEKLRARGVSIRGNAASVCFPRRYYYDMCLHMNMWGAYLYSFELGRTICKELGLPYQSDLRGNTVSFEDHPEVVSCENGFSRYRWGIRLKGDRFSIALKRPHNVEGKRWHVNLLFDRSGAGGQVVAAVSLGGRPLPFRESVHRAKNMLDLELPDDVDSATVDVAMKDGVCPGLERTFSDWDDYCR